MVSLSVYISAHFLWLPDLAQGSDERIPWRSVVFKKGISELELDKQKGMFTQDGWNMKQCS